MKRFRSVLFFLVLVFYLPDISVGQRVFWHPEGSFAIEVSLQNSNLKRLPIYQNSIKSLAVIDDKIIGGTSAKEGLTPFLFVASISDRKLVEFENLEGRIAGQRSIEAGFCKLNNNQLITGSIANGDSNEGGHLIQVEVNNNYKITIEDLGIPIPGEGIFTLVCNKDRNKLYGISYPTGYFFSYNISTEQTIVFDEIVPNKEELNSFHTYGLKPDKYLGAALIESNEGMIYGSKGLNDIFYFNPTDDTFHTLDDSIPEVWGRTSLGQIESWVKDDEGILYGGNAGEGQLVKLNPSTNKVTNLGKPIMMNQMPGLAIGADGKIYGIAGGPPGYAHLFSYDENEGYFDYGNPTFTMAAPGIEQGITWRAYNIATVESSEDGKYIVLGENESLSQLLIFPVSE